MTHIKSEDEKREKLPAEKQFDGWVYGGISYAAQAIAGSALTYWMRHSSGRPIFDKIANWVGPNFISKITKKRGIDAVKEADSWITVSTMVAMGTAFVAPVKWLEDIKADMVEKWTRQDNERREARGDAPTPDELQHQQDLLSELKAQPKQDWTTLMSARAFSLIPVYGALYGIGKKNNSHMEHAFQNVTSSIASSVGAKNLAKSEPFRNASGIAFYDGFYSMISASGLYVYSHFIAPPQKRAPQARQAQPEEPSEKKSDVIDLKSSADGMHHPQAQTSRHAESVRKSQQPEAPYTMAL